MITGIFADCRGIFKLWKQFDVESLRNSYNYSKTVTVRINCTKVENVLKT